MQDERLVHLSAEILRVARETVVRPRYALYLNAVSEKHLAQGDGAVFGRVLDGQGDMQAVLIRRPVDANVFRAGLAVNAGAWGLRAGQRGQRTLKRVVGSVGVPRRSLPIIGRQIEIDHVVIQGERGDGRAIAPLQIVPSPA